MDDHATRNGARFPGNPEPHYEGRLELTWTNKHLRLLAHDDGSYEWTEPSDYRVAESGRLVIPGSRAACQPKD